MTELSYRPFPYGWFQVSYSHELEVGEARPVHYFDEEMVLFRGDDGLPKLVEAYCPHMGAHLGHGVHSTLEDGTCARGKVSGNRIVCPFHGWDFNGDGYCESVPYATKMPPTAVGQQLLKTWPLCERNGTIWMWYHPAGQPPKWEVESFAELDPQNELWSEFETYRWTIKTHCQEMAENGADPAHFFFVHGVADAPLSTQDFDRGPRREGVIEAPLDTPRGRVEGRIAYITQGPGLAVTRFTGLCETIELGNVTPIDKNTVELNYAFSQQMEDGKKTGGGIAAAIIRDIVKQTNEDIVIWEHKIYRDKPLLCDGDGPIAKFRKWYSQFYYEG
mgnify:CR=1 FL=1